ncbi:MAG: hypothetical protein QF685_00810 [Verrucomicrobiota bacterium]|nr:hypothetical protein [Verrucomicrobiota bacterium]
MLFLLGYIAIVFILKKYHDSEADNPDQQSKWISVTLKIIRQFPGYAAALLLPANLIITFLAYAYLTTVPGSDQGDGFYMPPDLFIVPTLVFSGLLALGVLMGIWGVIMILFGERNPRYVLVASIRLAAHLLLPFIGLAVLFLLSFFS